MSRVLSHLSDTDTATPSHSILKLYTYMGNTISDLDINSTEAEIRTFVLLDFLWDIGLNTCGDGDNYISGDDVINFAARQEALRAGKIT